MAVLFLEATKSKQTLTVTLKTFLTTIVEFGAEISEEFGAGFGDDSDATFGTELATVFGGDFGHRFHNTMAVGHLFRVD